MSGHIARLCLFISLVSTSSQMIADTKSWWSFDFSTTASAQTDIAEESTPQEKRPSFLKQCQQWTGPVLVGSALLIGEHIYNRFQRNNLRKLFNENMAETRNVMGEEFTKQFEKQAKEMREIKQELQQIRQRNEILTAALNEAMGNDDNDREEENNQERKNNENE